MADLSKIGKDIEQCKTKAEMHASLDKVQDGDLCLFITRTKGGGHTYNWYGRTYASERLGLLNYARVMDERSIK